MTASSPPPVHAARQRALAWPTLLILVAWGLLYLTPIFLAVIGMVFGLRWLMKVSAHRASDPALDILRQRYARGEISKEEFEAKKRDLS